MLFFILYKELLYIIDINKIERLYLLTIVLKDIFYIVYNNIKHLLL